MHSYCTLKGEKPQLAKGRYPLHDTATFKVQGVVSVTARLQGELIKNPSTLPAWPWSKLGVCGSIISHWQTCEDLCLYHIFPFQDRYCAMLGFALRSKVPVLLIILYLSGRLQTPAAWANDFVGPAYWTSLLIKLNNFLKHFQLLCAHGSTFSSKGMNCIVSSPVQKKIASAAVTG